MSPDHDDDIELEREGGDAPGDRGAAWADDERLKVGVEHLQRAAQEAIAAGRAMLDVAEDLVGDPHSLNDLLGLLGKIGSASGPRRRVVAHDDDPDGDPPVQRIPVS